jgi:hypothetical protein
MSASPLRGWLLGLALAVGSGAGSYFAVSHGQQAQQERLDRVAEELSLLRKAVMARPPGTPPDGERGVAAGMPPSLRSGEARLRPEDLDAIAARMVTHLHQSGVLQPSGHEQPSPKPAPLEPEQQQSLARASGMVDRVLAMGRMTTEDVLEIRRELSALKSRAEADEVRRRIVVAINKNQLVPPDGPESLP